MQATEWISFKIPLAVRVEIGEKKKYWSGRAKLLCLASGMAGPGPKFLFNFRAEPGPGGNF